MAQDLSLYKKPLSEVIAEIIKEDIHQRKLKLGDRLVEADLAERFEVSRSTIREALKILEQEHLVFSEGRKGTFIADFTREDMDELIEVRMILEAKAFVKALPHLKEEHFKKLSNILEEMKQAGEKEDWYRLFDLDMEFHQYVIELCGNSRIIQIYESIQVQIRVYLAHLDQYYSSAMAYYEEHKELYDILLEKDPERVEKQTIHHIEYVEEKILRGDD
jgi:DNA-binding GntR family transcriptional regulator